MNLNSLSSHFKDIVECPKIILDLFREGKFGKNDLLNKLTAFKDARFVKKVNRQGEFKTIIDVGANVGNFSRAYKKVFPAAKIYSFEPIKKTFKELNKIKGIKKYNLALGDTNKKVMISYFPEKHESSTLKEIINFPKSIKRISMQVKMKRFDSLNLEIKRPCFLKIDVEGLEMEVLMGFGNRLNEVDFIQFEHVHQKHFKNQNKLGDILRLLEKYGFYGFYQNVLRERRGVLWMSDLYFFRFK